MKRLALLHSTLLLTLMTMPNLAQNRTMGIVGHPAPSWTVDRWFQLPAGVESLDVSDFRGKVLYVFCFQSWCPGCHSHGFPALRKVSEHFDGRDEVAFVAIQTVFEGFHANTADRGRQTMAEYDLDIPFGQAVGSHSESPDLMRRYRTGGTPWTILIDRDGVVRFNGFSVDPSGAIQAIESLLPQPPGEEL